MYKLVKIICVFLNIYILLACNSCNAQDLLNIINIIFLKIKNKVRQIEIV